MTAMASISTSHSGSANAATPTRVLAGGGCRNEKPVGMIRKLADQTPFLIRELGARREPSARLLTLTHGRKLQGEDAAKLVLGFRVFGEKGIGVIDQNASKLEGLSGKTEQPVPTLSHLRPHVVECIR
jgi:hypothetical protein